MTDQEMTARADHSAIENETADEPRGGGTPEEVFSAIAGQARARLLDAIAGFEEEAREARQTAATADRLAARIRDAARAEEWWRLKGILSDATIELFSNESPVGLLDSEDD